MLVVAPQGEFHIWFENENEMKVENPLFSNGELPATTQQHQQEGEFEERGQLSSDGASCQGQAEGQSQGQAECQGQAEGQGPGGEQGHGTGQDPGLFPLLHFSFSLNFGWSLSQPLLLIACNFFYCLLK